MCAVEHKYVKYVIALKSVIEMVIYARDAIVHVEVKNDEDRNRIR